MRGWRVGNRVEDVVVANVIVANVADVTAASVEETTHARLNGGVSESGVASAVAMNAVQMEPIHAQSHAADALVFWPDRMELLSDYKTDPMAPGRGIRNANG